MISGFSLHKKRNVAIYYISVVFLGFIPPLVVQRSKTRGGINPKNPKSPDFGPFALENWPKNTTNFPAAFGGQKGEIQGGEPEEYH